MESKTSLEREMTLKAFTESGIQTVLYVVEGMYIACWLMDSRSGGAQDISFGIGGDFNWQNQQSIHGIDKEATTAVHGFYNVFWTTLDIGNRTDAGLVSQGDSSSPP